MSLCSNDQELSKFQAPLNGRYKEVLTKAVHLTIKTTPTGHAKAWITFSDISPRCISLRLKTRKNNGSHSGSSIQFDAVNLSFCHTWRK